MLIKKAEYLHEELAYALAVNDKASSFTVYIRWNNTWNDIAVNPVTDTSVTEKLDLARSAFPYFREASSCDCYYPIESFDAIILVNFNKAPNTSTRNIFIEIINKCLDHSNNKFHATHDTLTGVINKKEFIRHTEIELSKLSKLGDATGSDDAESGLSELSDSVLILSLDIDFFKKVNDDYGHIYGDIVLKCFASRLTRLIKEMSDPFSLQLARTGGEEFAILIAGNIDGEAKDICTKINKCVEDTPLPDEDEWAQHADNAQRENVPFPHASERKITVSIGASSIVSTIGGNIESLATKLLEESDIALYKSKSGGRNTSTHFTDIRKSHGRIIEQNSTNKVVAIDIGSRVGLRVGQEFSVYQPNFCGSVPFMINDGRTNKKLGTYPKRSTGRIIVFDVQKEISFCYTSSEPNTNFEPKSSIEALPVGAFAHLIDKDITSILPTYKEIATKDQIEGTIATISSAGNWPLTVVMTIENSDALIEERGPSFLSKSLAALYTSIKNKLPKSTIIGQIEPTVFAAVAARDVDAFDENTIEEILNIAAKKCNNTTRFCAGISSSVHASSDSADQSTLASKNALDYARYAATKEGRRNSQTATFTPDIAARVVSSSRTNKDYSKALFDYNRLAELGIKNAGMENTAGLTYFVTGNKPDAIDAFSRAIEINGDYNSYITNLAVVYYYSEKYLEAYNQFKRIEENPKIKLRDESIAIYLICADYVYKEGLLELDGNLLTTIASKVTALGEDKWDFITDKSVVTDILASYT